MIYLLIALWLGFLACAVIVWAGNRKRREAPSEILPTTATPENEPDASETQPAPGRSPYGPVQRNLSVWVRATGGVLVAATFLYLFTGFNTGSLTKRLKHEGMSSTGYSMPIGTKTVWVRPGKNIVIDYNVTLHSGEILLWIKKSNALFLTRLDEDPLWQTKVVESGSGTFRVPITEKGFYRIFIGEMPTTKRYNGKFHIAWKVR